LGAGLSGGLYYGDLRLKQEKRLHQEIVSDVNKKKEQIYKRYQEKNALSSQLLRAKSSLEARIREIEKEIEKKDQEKAVDIANYKKLEKDIEKKDNKIASLEGEIGDIKTKLDNVVKEGEKKEKKYISEINELKEKKNLITLEKKNVESELKTVKRALDRARNHNGELCILAEDLLAGYENKGTFTSMLEKEPFLQLKKIELEKYIQEYQDKIEIHRHIEGAN
jgi:chromosome segregation ATPase